MNAKNIKLDATILNLTVAQAHASFFKAVKLANFERADKIKFALRHAAQRLREALDLTRKDINHPDRAHSNAEALVKAQNAERNLVADLDRIAAVMAWKPGTEKAPPVTLAGALRAAGVAG